ncbi:MAG: dNTP triphosphohydrolase [Dehalococcoidia bacterium]
MPALRTVERIYKCEICGEAGLLSGYATHSKEALRLNPDKDGEHKYRTKFARDRDKILYTDSFRRLVHKSQIFVSGDPSKCITRLTHTLRVAQVAQTIARALRLNEELAIAIAMGHDIGHPPYGHLGENALRELMINDNGFEHNEESVWILALFEKLNLTSVTLEGILKHTKFNYNEYQDNERKDPFLKCTFPGCTDSINFNYFGSKGSDGRVIFKHPSSIEGQVVDLADEIAYIAHDLVDLRKMKVVEDNEFPESWKKQFGLTDIQRNVTDRFITAAIDHNAKFLDAQPNSEKEIIEHPPDLSTMVSEIKDWEKNIFNEKLKEQKKYADDRIYKLFSYFTKKPHELKKYHPNYYEKINEYCNGAELVCHCIATMTDIEVDKIFVEIS